MSSIPPAGLHIPSVISNPNLSVGQSLADAVLADANILRWFQADAARATLDGAGNDQIITLADRKGTSGVFTRNTSAGSPTLVPAIFNGFPGARFASADSDRMLYTGTAIDLALPHSWLVVGRAANNTASRNIVGSFTSSSSRDILNFGINAAGPSYQFGSSKTADVPVTLGAPFAALTSWDGTTMQLDVNSTLSAKVTPSAPVPGSAQLVLGALTAGSISQPFDGDIAEVMYIGRGLLDGSEASASTLALLKRFVAKIYSLSL